MQVLNYDDTILHAILITSNYRIIRLITILQLFVATDKIDKPFANYYQDPQIKIVSNCLNDANHTIILL